MPRPSALDDLHRALGQGGDEGLAVLLGQDAVVEGDDNTLVGLGANQPAHPLAQLQNGLRQGKLRERNRPP